MFQLRAHGTRVPTEIRAGVVTFATMAYIVFVQPAVLSGAGMDFGAVMTVTCLAAAAGTLIMAFAANLPIALAPGMGENFFFVSVATGAATGVAVGWRAALAAVFVSGALFLVLGAFRLRERVFAAVPPSLKHAIAGGIGLFIAFIGLKEAGLVVAAPGALVRLGNLRAPATLLALGGLALTCALHVRRVAWALLAGMLATAGAGVALGLIRYRGIAGLPPSPAPILGQLDLAALGDARMAPVVATFLFMVLFDTVGTLIGVGAQTGLAVDRKLGRAFLADAAATTLGATLGTSTVTVYVESAAGVAAGGRTGLAAVTTAALFLVALVLSPLVEMVGGDVGGLHPVTAPALILVGSLMARGLRAVEWDDAAEAIPAFLVVVGVPLTFSIADGLALGFIAHPLLRAATGRRPGALLTAIAALFALRYAFL
jgi:AGZA family xanthine/uracil permease-like MFS transporter